MRVNWLNVGVAVLALAAICGALFMPAGSGPEQEEAAAQPLPIAELTGSTGVSEPAAKPARQRTRRRKPRHRKPRRPARRARHEPIRPAPKAPPAPAPAPVRAPVPAPIPTRPEPEFGL